MERQREIRRALGVLGKSLTRLDLASVHDPRSRANREWPLINMLGLLVAACVAGCRSLKEAELLSAQLNAPIRRRLGIARRVPDTTMRDVIMGLQLDDLRDLLHQQTRAAHRSKQLRPEKLPCGVLAIDGKYSRTTKPRSGAPSARFAHRQSDDCWLVRRMSCALISAPVPLCVDSVPIPRGMSEASFLPQVLGELERAFGRLALFEVVTADAGLTSEENARLINSMDLGYVLGLKDNQPTLLDEAHRHLSRLSADMAKASSETRLDNRTSVIRRVWLTTEMAGYHDWDHLRTVVRVQSEKRVNDEIVEQHDRYFVSNVPRNRFTPAQWLTVIRGHWRVENECHGVWDRFFREDDRPWFKVAHGQLVIDILRRVAFNLLDLYRRVSRRPRPKSERGGMRWTVLFSWMRLALTAATQADAAKLGWLRRGRDGPPIGHTVK